MGKNNDTWSYVWNEEVKFIKFKCNENDLILKWLNKWNNDKDSIIIDVVGKCGLNNFGGVLTSQVIILDYEKVG